MGFTDEKGIPQDTSSPRYPAEVVVTDLPSNFLPYPEGIEITYTPYEYGEVESLNEAHMTTEDAFRFILKGIKTKGIKNEDLTLPDFLFIALLRKLSTLGDSKFVAKNFLCVSCKTSLELVFSIKEHLKFDYMEAPKLPVKADQLGELKDVKFTPLTIGDYLELARTKKLNKGQKKDTVAMMAKQARNVDYDTAYKVIYSLVGKDHARIRQIDGLLYHSLQAVESKCNKCGAPTSLMLDGWEAVIIPFRGEGDPEESGISFGD